MPEKRVPEYAGKKHVVRRAALTVTAVAAATVALAPAPTAGAELENRGVAYDLFYDFPGTVNPVTFANSIVQTALQPQFLSRLPVCTECEELMGDIYAKPHPQGGVVFVPEYNALLYPLRGLEIATVTIASVSDFDFAEIPVIGRLPAALTAVANAYEESVDILIDIGYDDVDADTFKRSYDQFGTHHVFVLDHPFGLFDYLAALNAAARSAAQGTKALIDGFVTNVTQTFDSAFGAKAGPLTAAVPRPGDDAGAISRAGAVDGDPAAESILAAAPDREKANPRQVGDDADHHNRRAGIHRPDHRFVGPARRHGLRDNGDSTAASLPSDVAD